MATCRVCNKECVAGQKDKKGRAAHYGCQATLPEAERNPRLAKHPAKG